MSNNILNLYHFTASDTLLKILLSNKFRFGNIKNVNDIHESKPYQISLFDSIKPHTITDDETRSLLIDCLRTIEMVRSSLYIGCFSSFSTDEEILNADILWGNYANKHKGCCIEFDKEILINLINESKSTGSITNGLISYLETIDTSTDLHDQALFKEDIANFIEKKYLVKKDMWSYEQEYRFIYFNTSIREDFFTINNILPAIKRIIVGFYMDKSDLENIQHLISLLDTNIKVQTTTLSQFI